jgi:serine/threonine protein phosphatase PrpC
MDSRCPACSEPVQPTDRFCEACGHELGTPVAEVVEPEVDSWRWLSATETPASCPGCGCAVFSTEGFCDDCGQRRPIANDHTELDLGPVAGVTDIGRRHHRNEDAMGIGVLDGAVVAVVCDGVSSSSRADAASHAAVDAAGPAMLGALAGGAEPGDAMVTAARAAQAAATLVAGPQPGPNPPSSTFVSAIVTSAAVTVGWVGDSRAYWLPDGDGTPECLTADDSLAGKLAAAGVDVRVIEENPQSGALVRWLGSDARDTEPHLFTFAPAGPGRVLVCSDGLFRYRPEVKELAASAPPGPLLATAQALVQLALDEGGQDNVTVVLVPYPPQSMEAAK